MVFQLGVEGRNLGGNIEYTVGGCEKACLMALLELDGCEVSGFVSIVCIDESLEEHVCEDGAGQ
jgi:hypothetical protein